MLSCRDFVQFAAKANKLDQPPWSTYPYSMTIHVNIGEAKTRFSELAARALRGEEVVVQKAGVPMLKLVPIREAQEVDRAGRQKRVDEILARIDALPIRKDGVDPLDWDENGLPI